MICSTGSIPDHTELYQNSKACLAAANSGWLFLDLLFVYFSQFKSVLFKLYLKIQTNFRPAVFFFQFQGYISTAYKKDLFTYLASNSIFSRLYCNYFEPQSLSHQELCEIVSQKEDWIPSWTLCTKGNFFHTSSDTYFCILNISRSVDIRFFYGPAPQSLLFECCQICTALIPRAKFSDPQCLTMAGAVCQAQSSRGSGIWQLQGQ